MRASPRPPRRAKLVIFGAGDIARLAHHYFSTDSEHEVAAFAVDARYRERDDLLGLPLVDFEHVSRLYPPGEFAFFVALSYARMNRLRAEKFGQVCELGYEVATYVSSRCTFLTAEPVGRNCFILEDNTIQPNVRIGENVTLWSGNHIGHDSVIEDHCFISSHVVVSGHVRVGRFCFLGVNATLRNSITLGPRTLVGAGAVIMSDTEEGSVYVPPRSQRVQGKSSDDVAL